MANVCHLWAAAATPLLHCNVCGDYVLTHLLVVLATVCRCVMNTDALVTYFDYHRSLGASVGILLGYLGVLHVLTYAGLMLVSRKKAA